MLNDSHLEAPLEARQSRFGAWWPYLLILAVGMVVLLPRLGDFGFWDPWEPKYAETAREMKERGSWIVPYYRQEVRLTKPILVYWGILVGSTAFGLNEFGARIVGVTLALSSMVGVFYALSRMRGRQAGLLAALVLGTVPYFFLQARQAMPDVYLFTSLGSSLVFLCLGLFGPDRRRNLHFAIGYVGFSLAVLAKGPVIVGLIWGVTLAIWAAAHVDLELLWRRDHRRDTIFSVVAAAVALPLIPVLLGFAFLFGSSPAWWGYSEDKREAVTEFRTGLLDRLADLHLSQIVLALVAVGALVWGLTLFKRRAPGRQPPVWGAVLAGTAAGVALVALVALFGAGAVRQSLAAALLAVVALLWLLAVVLRRLLSWPDLGGRIRPLVAPVVRQLLLFAVVFAVVAGPWHIGILIAQDHGYFTDFIIKHNVQRAAEKINRSGVSDFYFRTLIFGFFPWSAFIPLALAVLIDWRDRSLLRKYGLELFLLIAATVTFVAFSIPVTKFPHYLTPIILPVCVLIGLTLDRLLRDRAPQMNMVWLVAGMLYVLPMMNLVFEEGGTRLVGVFTMKRAVPESMDLDIWYHIPALAFAVGLVLAAFVRSRLVVGSLILCAGLMATYSNSVFIPRVSVNKTMKHLAETWRTHGEPLGEPIGFHGDMKHGIFFYTDYKIKVLRKTADFFDFMDPGRPAFCIMERGEFHAKEQAYRARHEGARLYLVDGSHFRYVLVTNHPLS